MGLSRRHLLLGAGVIGAGWLLKAPALRFLNSRFDFVDLSSPEGFRALEGGQLSGGFDPFFGLEPTQRSDFTTLVHDTRAALPFYLFGDVPAGTVPIASFSDYNCPYCRVLTRRLNDLAQDSDVHIAWHELPLLGLGSRIGAQAALAARAQGRYLEMHKRLMKSGFRITPDYIDTVAQDLGFDVEQLNRDMRGGRVTQQINRTKALAEIFGIIGTPALVVGRTLVIGEISLPRLDALISRERADNPSQG